MSFLERLLQSRSLRIAALLLASAGALLVILSAAAWPAGLPAGISAAIGTAFILLALCYFGLAAFDWLGERLAGQVLAELSRSRRARAATTSSPGLERADLFTLLLDDLDRSIRRLERLQFPPDADAPGNDAGTYRTMAQRYGIGYASAALECKIAADGSARVERIVNVEAFSEISQLDTVLFIPEPEPGTARERVIELINLHSLSRDRKLSILPPRSDEGGLSLDFRISAPLRSGENLKYLLEEQLPAGTFAIDLTPEAMRRRENPHDYFGFRINRPTRKLSLRVYFPGTVLPQNDAVDGKVFYAPVGAGVPRRTQYEEERNLPRPDRTGNIFTLEVDYPMVGLIYLLQWHPPTTESVTGEGDEAGQASQPGPASAGLAEERSALLARLAIHRRNLADLRAQRAVLGIQATPALNRQIEVEEIAVQELEQELQDLETPPG